MEKLKNFGKALWEAIKILTVSFGGALIVTALLILLMMGLFLIFKSKVIVLSIMGVLVLLGWAGLIYWIDYK